MQCVRIEKLGPWGNQASTNWSMQLGEHETIKEVTIRHGFIVDAIGFTVSDRCGKTTTTLFGGPGGKTDKIVLKANEYISYVSGTHAEYEYDGCKRHISSIKIHTNLNPTGYGPYGIQKGIKNTVSFSSPVPLNGIISGFFGRADQYLDSIGLYVNKQEVQKFGPWGSQSPTNWDMKMGECETIKDVTIRSGFIVDAIGFTVADKCGRTTTTCFGGSGGSCHKISLKPNEYVTQISGTHGVYKYTNQRHIASIKIHTNLCPTGYGPYGLGKDISNACSFSSPVPNASTIIDGFFGRSGSYLDSIGVYMKRGGY